MKPATIATAVALVAMTHALTPAKADDFYAGKRLSIVAGFAPGGGYDSYARVLSRHIGRHVPGNPTTIVQNMPGAGSLTAVKHLYTTAPQDGTVMAIFNGALIQQALSNPDLGVDFTKMRFVGSASGLPLLCYAWHATGIKTLDDLRTKEFIIGSSSKGSSSYIGGALLKSMLRAPVKVVLGYPGTAETLIAIERGELHGDCGAWTNISPDWLANNKVTPIVRFSRSVGTGMPDIPHIADVVKTEEERQIIALVASPYEMGRLFIMGPDVPPDRLATLRAGFNATLKDPDFLADVEKARLEVIGPMTGEQVEASVRELYGTSKDIVVKAMKAIE